MPGIATEKSRRSSREAWLVMAVILMVFAGALLLVTQRLRKELRAKIIQQDGVALGAALMVPSLTHDLPEEVAKDPEILFAQTAEKVLEVTRREKDIFGARVFTQTGVLELSIGGSAGDLAPGQVAQLREGKAINWFEPHARLGNLVEHSSDAEAPMIHTIVPLEQVGRFIGAAEFISDGQEVMKALRKLDRDLWVYAGLIFFMVGGITTGTIFWNLGLRRTRSTPCAREGLENSGSLCGSGT